MTRSCIHLVINRLRSNWLYAKQICTAQKNSRADLQRRSRKTTSDNSPTSLQSTERRSTHQQQTTRHRIPGEFTNTSILCHTANMCQMRIIQGRISVKCTTSIFEQVQFTPKSCWGWFNIRNSSR